MLCTIALRRLRSNADSRYDLRIAGKTALGPSGTGGHETRTSQTADEVRATLRQLGLGPETLTAAESFLHNPRTSEHFTAIAEDVQIAWDVLERADIALFD